jgi:hypothetical protein
MPDCLNLTTSFYGSAALRPHEEGIIVDNRDLHWFITHQHGINVPGIQWKEWARTYLDAKEKGKDRRDLIVDLLSVIDDSDLKWGDCQYVRILIQQVFQFIKILPDNEVDKLESLLLEKGKRKISRRYVSTHDVLKKFQYQYDGNYYTPYNHKGRIYWFCISHPKDIIDDITFIGYEDVNSYIQRKSLLVSFPLYEKDVYTVEQLLVNTPLPKEAYTFFIKKLQENVESDGEEYEEDDYEY